jgi:hypothetical protein
MNFRRLLAIILFVAITIGIGYLLWSLFLRGPEGAPEPIDNVNEAPIGGGLEPAVNGAIPGSGAAVNGALPIPTVSPVAKGGLTAVTPVAAVSTIGASVSTNGNLSFYDRNDGKFYRITPDGTVAALSGKQFYDVSDAVFDPSGSRAIIIYPDRSKISYDFNTGTQVTLPRHWEDFQFNHDGSNFVTKSLAIDPNARFLVISKPDGSSARAVQELGSNQDKVTLAYSPTGQVIATAATGAKLGADRQEIYLVGQNQENFKSLTVEGLNFIPKWAPSGAQMLYSVAGSASDWKPQLWVVDAQGDDIGRNRKSINLNTWADKCAFIDDRTAYCAAAPDLPEGAGINREVANDYPDEFYRVDISTGLITRAAQPEGEHVVDKVMLSPDGSKLYFTDKGSGVLNQILLK